MTVPVSLAEIRNRMANSAHLVLTHRELEPLVELAEAYLKTRPGIHDSCREQCEAPDACETKRQAALARLALAAKGVRP